MERRYEGKVVLITGGSSGIGRATALAFAKEGAKVVVADIAADGGRKTVRMIQEAGGEAIFAKTDVSKEDEVEAMVKKAVETYGRLDYAHNNAGILGTVVPTADYTEKDWNHVIDVNLKGVWLCMKYEIPQMRKQGGGAIVNTSSALGLRAERNLPAYIASKHAVVGLTKAAAMEYAQAGIRINTVCPGAVRTRMQELPSGSPVGRLPEEVAELVVWLCSDEAKALTGQILTDRQWKRQTREPSNQINSISSGN